MLSYLSRVVGPPGCGKTTYLSRQVRRAWEAGHEVMVTSLTRAAAAEVAGRDLPLDPHRIGTLHRHCFRALAGTFTGIADTPKFISEWNRDYPELALSGADRDLDEDNANPYDGGNPGDVVYNAMNCFRARLIKQDVWPLSVRGFAKLWNDWKANLDLIDFTDMLEIARDFMPIAPGNPDVIFADEAQDFSALEMAVLNQWGVKAGRLVVVGDPYQALYEWRGSDPAVFFEGEVPPDNYRVLGQSYRVPRTVHQCAMQWLEKMPGYSPIEYQPTEAEGQVSSLNASWRNPDGILPVLEESLANNKTVMILASCAYMLSPILKMLREEGIPFHNEYRRKNGAWNPLTRMAGKTMASDRLIAFLRLGEEGFWTRDDLLIWLPAMKCSEFMPNKQSFKKIEAGLRSWSDGEIPYWLAEATVGEAAAEAGMALDTNWYLEHIQSSRKKAALFLAHIADHRGSEGLRLTPRVTIGTIHSVKGGESDVVIVAPDLSLRGIDHWHSGAEGQASVYRLMYVAMTRAKEALHILRPATSSMAVRLR